jgi:hypothetical protein
MTNDNTYKKDFFFLLFSYHQSSSDDALTDLSSSCSINIDQSHIWSLTKSTDHRNQNRNSFGTIIQDFGK